MQVGRLLGHKQRHSQWDIKQSIANLEGNVLTLLEGQNEILRMLRGMQTVQGRQYGKVLQKSQVRIQAESKDRDDDDDDSNSSEIGSFCEEMREKQREEINFRPSSYHDQEAKNNDRSDKQERGQDLQQSVMFGSQLMHAIDNQYRDLYQQEVSEHYSGPKLSFQRSSSPPEQVLKAKSSSEDLLNINSVLEQLSGAFEQLDLQFTTGKLMYSYPGSLKDKPVNSTLQLMSQIVDKPNFLLLMCLSPCGPILGGFTQLPFSSKPVLIPKQNPKCFLFNLDLSHYLFASRTNKTHSVDRNCLMFGSWDIKLKVGEAHFETQLAKNGGCFGLKSFRGKVTGADMREWFFGDIEAKRKYELSTYAIYQLQ